MFKVNWDEYAGKGNKFDSYVHSVIIYVSSWVNTNNSGSANASTVML